MKITGSKRIDFVNNAEPTNKMPIQKHQSLKEQFHHTGHWTVVCVVIMKKLGCSLQVHMQRV